MVPPRERLTVLYRRTQWRFVRALLPDQTDQQTGLCLPVPKQTFLFGDLLVFPVQRRWAVLRRRSAPSAPPPLGLPLPPPPHSGWRRLCRRHAAPAGRQGAAAVCDRRGQAGCGGRGGGGSTHAGGLFVWWAWSLLFFLFFQGGCRLLPFAMPAHTRGRRLRCAPLVQLFCCQGVPLALPRARHTISKHAPHTQHASGTRAGRPKGRPPRPPACTSSR